MHSTQGWKLHQCTPLKDENSTNSLQPRMKTPPMHSTQGWKLHQCIPPKDEYSTNVLHSRMKTPPMHSTQGWKLHQCTPPKDENSTLFVTLVSAHYNKWILCTRFRNHVVETNKSIYEVGRKSTNEVLFLHHHLLTQLKTIQVFYLKYHLLFQLQNIVTFMTYLQIFIISLWDIYSSFCQPCSAPFSTSKLATSNCSTFFSFLFLILLLPLLFKLGSSFSVAVPSSFTSGFLITLLQVLRYYRDLDLAAEQGSEVTDACFVGLLFVYIVFLIVYLEVFHQTSFFYILQCMFLCLVDLLAQISLSLFLP